MIKIKEVVVNAKQLQKLEEIANMNLKAINNAVKFGIKKFKTKANAKIDQCYQMIEAKEKECIDLQDELEDKHKKYNQLAVDLVKQSIQHSNEIFDLKRRLVNRNWLIASIIVIGTLISIYFNL